MTREDRRARLLSVMERKRRERMARKKTCNGSCGESSPRCLWCLVTREEMDQLWEETRRLLLVGDDDSKTKGGATEC